MMLLNLGSLAREPKRLVFYLILSLLALAPEALAQDWVYTVRPGDNIWDLSQKYLNDKRLWRRLQLYNNVADPQNLPPGTRLRFPVAWLSIQPAAVVVRAVQGEASIFVAATRRTVSAEPQMTLRAGDRIRTGENGNITLEFADGSQLLVQSASELELDAVTAYEDTGMVDTRLRLQRGRTDNRIVPAEGPGTRYQITTPSAISAVRGTDYRVAADGDSALTRAEVLSGRVDVRASNRTVVVSAGFGAVVEAGRAPTPPIELLPPPDLSVLPEVFERVPLPIQLNPLAGAAAYRMQIAPDESFSTLLFDGTFTSPNFRGPDLPDGVYFLRVRAIDERGLEGRDAVNRFVLNARPEPPVLIAPEFEGVVPQEQPIFQWAQQQGADSYRFQLATDESFANPISALENVDDNALAFDSPLAPGAYFWRVATTDDTGQGPFSDPQPFRRPQPSPSVEAPEVEGETLTLRWNEGLPGEQYQIQFTNDYTFNTILVDVRVSEPQITLVRPESGLYYLRIRLIESDGFEGPLGPAQRISVPPKSYWPLLIFTLLVI